MIEGRPRESLVLYDNPIEVAAGMDLNQMNPHRKSFGSKLSIAVKDDFTDENIVIAICLLQA